MVDHHQALVGSGDGTAERHGPGLADPVFGDVDLALADLVTEPVHRLLCGVGVRVDGQLPPVETGRDRLAQTQEVGRVLVAG
jgi:hypothetical protein